FSFRYPWSSLMRRMSHDDDRAFHLVKHRRCHFKKGLKTLKILKISLAIASEPHAFEGKIFAPAPDKNVRDPRLRAPNNLTRRRPFLFHGFSGIVYSKRSFRSENRCGNWWLEAERAFG